jgi:tetratricopeptide (TPR) repeat protein
VSRRLRLTLFVITCILAAGAATAVVVPVIRGVRDARETAAVLARVDADISGGWMERAGDRMRAMRSLPREEKMLLAVLARAYAVSSSAGDFSLLAVIARKAQAANRRSPRVRLVAAYAALRTGAAGEASALLAHGAPGGELADSLRAEAAIRTGAAPAASFLPSGLAALETSRDPVAFEKAAGSSGEPALLLDAALLRMGQGDGRAAAAICRELPSQPAYDEPAALLLHDAGDMEAARERLMRRAASPGRSAEIVALLGDCEMQAGRTAEAGSLYEEALSLDMRVSWAPYLNLARLSDARGKGADAAAYRARARELFPEREEVFLESARLCIERGDARQGERVLSSYLKAHPDSLEAGLMMAELEAPRISPEAYRARLWKLFNARPSDPRAALTLMDALLAVRDWKGAAAAARQYEAVGGDRPSVLMLRAAAQALSGELAAAQDAFKSVRDLRSRAASRYDLALVLLQAGRVSEARDALDEAAAALPSGAAARTFASLISTRIAQAELMNGGTAEARAALARALSADPGNRIARLLSRKLDEARQ